MICKNCGTKAEDDSKFCPFCGLPMNGEQGNGSTENVDNGGSNGSTEEAASQVNKGPYYSKSTANNSNANASYSSNNNTSHGRENNSNDTNRKVLGIFSLVFAIIAILTCFMVIFSIPFALISIVLASLIKPKNGFVKASLIISIIGIIISILFTVFVGFVTKKAIEEEKNNIQYSEEIESLMDEGLPYDDDTAEFYFYGQSCKIPYTNPWVEKSLTNGDAALIYGTENAFLTQVGFSLLSDTGKPFITEEDRKVFYDDLYEFWKNQCNNENAFVLLGGSDGLVSLDENIYMATFDYGLSKDSASGKFIMLVDPEKNAALSFRTFAENSAEEHDKRCIDLLKKIEIDQQEKVTVVDDATYDALDNMSAWNMYDDLRSGELAKEASIEGEWRILEEYSSSYIFKDGRYVNFNKKENMEENYINGSYVADYGKIGFLVAGLDESKLQEIIDNSNGQVSEEDICVLTCSIDQFVKDGVQQELPKDHFVTQVWIIVDHGDEGIEAQVYNMNNNSLYYYVKTLDKSSLEENDLLE